MGGTPAERFEALRLTQEIRKRICSAMLHSLFKAQEEALNEEKEVAFHAFCDFVLGENKAVFESLPAYLVGKLNNTAIFIIAPHAFSITLRHKRVLPFCFLDWTHFDPDLHPSTKELLAIRKKEADLTRQKDAIRKEFMSVLNAVSSVKQLLSVFPEAEGFIPRDVKEQIKIASQPVSIPEELKDLLASAQKQEKA